MCYDVSYPGKDDMKEFDPESLEEFNGKDGKPVYVAFKGKVFNLSESRLWKTGTHMKRHASGQDLTAEIEAAPHGHEVLDKYPQVGVLKKKKDPGSLPNPLEMLLERFPFFRRHPHPMLVHFPIAFSITPALFCILFLITDVKSFETTAFHCLGAGILFSVPAILTGFFTWWLNYQARSMRPIMIKIYLSLTLFCVALIAFLWRYMFPDVFTSLGTEGMIYLLLVILLVPIVSVIGWFGAGLTFPLERE
jgi:predicted heme/steroid binding protein/uncharacterized membrane protein